MSEDLLINLSQGISQRTAAAWDSMWTLVLDGGLFQVLCNAGAVIAVFCLFLFMVDFTKKWLDNEGNMGVLGELVWPVLVILLLAQGGANLATLSLGIRNTINAYNTQALSIVSQQLDFAENLAILADYSTTDAQVTALRSQCNTLVDVAELQACIEEQNERAQQLIREYRDTHQGAALWVDDLKRKSRINQIDPNRPLMSLAGMAISFSPLMTLVEGILIATQAAFQNLIEVSMLLTALLGPIAVGSSLLPFGAKPIFAWLTGFFSLGICKLSLNIITGLVASATAAIGPTDTLPIAICIGILGPILAFAMAAGGGLAVFTGITSAAGKVAGLVSRFI